MSQVCISYGSLKDASSEAGQVAKKLNTYANHLDSQVYRKLNSYSGSYTENIAQAKSNISSKISDLRNRANAYSTYSNDLADLKDQCDSTDKAVRLNVSKLTAKFKSANGIRDSKVQNSINYLLTRIGNKTSAGRWIGNKKDEFNSGKDYIKQSIEDWWDYEGGAELIKGIAEGVLAAVIAIAGVIISGGALAIIVGAIALAGAIVNICNEVAAYNATRNGDPATGRRRSDINSVQDYLRSTFIYDDQDIKYDKDHYNEWYERGALGIDVVNFVCQSAMIVDGIVDGIGNLTKNTYKWTTGSMADISNLRIRDILTRDNFTAFKSKIATSVADGFTDIKYAIRSGNFTKIKEFTFRFGDDFLNNLKKGYTFEIFAEDTKKADFVKHGASLVKNYASITKTFVSNGFNSRTIIGNIETIVVKNINIAEVVTYRGGQGPSAYDVNHIRLSDITGKFKDIKNLGANFGNVVGKLSEKSGISIQIPEINMPDLSGINSINIQIA